MIFVPGVQLQRCFFVFLKKWGFSNRLRHRISDYADLTKASLGHSSSYKTGTRQMAKKKIVRHYRCSFFRARMGGVSTRTTRPHIGTLTLGAICKFKTFDISLSSYGITPYFFAESPKVHCA